MQISELSRASRVPLPTLKFYLREGLLPPGNAIAINRAQYGDAHFRRLHLIRALTEIGRLPLKTVRAVIRAIEDQELPLHDLLGIAHWALEPEAPVDVDPMRDAVDALVDGLGWEVDNQAPARRTLGQALATLRDLGHDVSLATLRRYAVAADSLAADEVATVPAHASRSDAVERAVVGTVLYETVLTALRRMAQEHRSAERFGRSQRVVSAPTTPPRCRGG
jgi:DNA-binding transcriptional MerR regulator